MTNEKMLIYVRIIFLGKFAMSDNIVLTAIMRHIPITIIILFFSVFLNAQILYECRSQNSDTVVYVFGTCHSVPVKAKIDTVFLTKLIHASDVIFSEIFVDDGDTSYKKMSLSLNKKLRYKNNGLLRNSVTKDEYAQIMNYYKSQYGTSTKEFRWSTYYLPQVMHNQLKYSNKKFYSLDKLLYSIAKQTNNKIKNLDNEQLLSDAYAMLSSQYDIKWLLNMVNHRDTSQIGNDLIIQYYLRQDTAGIAGVLRASPLHSLHQKVLIENRNKHWFKVIDQHLERSNFIYCGLAHVISGESSLLNFFRTKQYSITEININIKTIH